METDSGEKKYASGAPASTSFKFYAGVNRRGSGEALDHRTGALFALMQIYLSGKTGGGGSRRRGSGRGCKGRSFLPLIQRVRRGKGD